MAAPPGMSGGWSRPRISRRFDSFEREQQLFDKVVQLEMETSAKGPSSEPARLLEQAAEPPARERLIYLSSGRQIEVDELHVEGAKVFWRSTCPSSWTVTANTSFPTRRDGMLAETLHALHG